MNRYQVFLTVVNTKSFTRAALELDYTQSAVSQMVHTLEDELDCTLLLRSKSGVVLTADGVQYMPYIRSICNACQDLERKHNEMKGLENSAIRIGTFTSVSRNWLPHLMKRFKERYPTVHFTLLQGEYTNIGQWIREGSVDFGFANSKAVSDLQLFELYQDEMLAVLPPGHPLASNTTLTLSQLAKEPLILLDEGAHSVTLEAFSKHGLTPDIHYRVYDDYSIISMVEQELGVSILYRTVLQTTAQNLVIRPITPPITRTVALACQDRRALSTASRAFIEFIQLYFLMHAHHP